MTRIVSFFSPKTAGSSSVSLNAALLHKLVNPQQKVAFVEISVWSSQAGIFQAQGAQSWEKIYPFLNTPEWNKKLLSRLSFSLGADLFWSPQGKQWPKFKPAHATAMLRLLQAEYDLIVIDIAASVPRDWHTFFTEVSDEHIGVLTPDPISLKSWNTYLEAFTSKTKARWLFNQVPNAEKKRLRRKFQAEDDKFLGVLRRDESRFWRQCYQGQPVSVQAAGKFKKDLESLLPEIFLA